MNKFKKCLWLIVFFCVFIKVNGQDTIMCIHCECDRPDYHAPIGVMIDHGHPKGEWMVSYRYMGMNMKGNMEGTSSVSNQEIYNMNYLMSADKMSMQMHMLMLMYGLTDKITLMTMIDYVHNSMDMSMMMYGMMNMGGSGSMNMSDNQMSSSAKTSGFRDIQLYALYTILEKKNHQIVLSGGVSIPTGSITLANRSQRYGYSMQIGTGSFSFLPGATYTGQSNLLSWGVQATGDLKINKNNMGYKWGNQLLANIWIAHNWTNWMSTSFRINGDAFGKINGYDPSISKYRTIDPGSDINNTGGFRTSAFVGINFLIPNSIFSNNRLAVEVGIPFYQNLNGLQMNTRTILNAGWQYTF